MPDAPLRIPLGLLRSWFEKRVNLGETPQYPPRMGSAPATPVSSAR